MQTMINIKMGKKMFLRKRKKIKIIQLKEMISNSKKFYIERDRKAKLTNLQGRKEFPIKKNQFPHLPSMDKMVRFMKGKLK